MARQIVITLPDDAYEDHDADYVEEVARQIREGYLSGHVDVDHHWTSGNAPKEQQA